MDVNAVEDAARRAVTAIRAGGGPAFLEIKTYRFRAHSMYDPELYRSREEVERWKERDPIPALSDALQQAGVLDTATLEQMEAEVVAEVDDAVAFAEAGTLEPVTDLERWVYSEAVKP